MNNHQLTTYTSGFILTSMRVITKSDFYNICKLLKSEFNAYYNTTEYEFEPEPITEGGIIFKKMPNMINSLNPSKTLYKSMRIYISMLGKYGFITENSLSEWENNQDILCGEKLKLDTYLKSFHGAPLWTIDELKIFKMCFEQHGFKCGKLPKKSDLVTTL